jgi:hypothetical protein
MSNQTSNAPIMQGRGSSSFFQTWINALTKPSEQTYAEMAVSPNAKATTAYLWVFVAVLVEFFFASLVQGATVRQVLQQQGLTENLPTSGLSVALITAICGAPILAVVSVIFFALGTALIQWIAKLFGGTGTFDQMTYAFGAIAAPYGLVSAVFALLGAIPFVGFCFRIVIGLAGIYVLVLNIIAVKGVNRFGWGQAVGSVLIPWAALFAVCCCAILAASAVLGPTIGNIFSEINRSLTGY